ncbi:FaeA/PapI family transcriptional regulator [Nanoarchaeota archaeon]
MENLNVNVPDQKLKITSYIQINGPVVGQNIAKKMGVPSFLASALLSELLRDKKIKASHLRVGGSPLYFVKGQEEKLENFTGYLAFKEKEAHRLLKEKGVLEDSQLLPPIRVAFGIMKDYAVPFFVSINGGDKLFWRHHILSQEDTQNRLKDLVKKMPKPKKQVEKPKAVVNEEIKEKELPVLKQAVEKKEETPKPKKKMSGGDLPLKVQEWMKKESVLMKEELESEGRIFRAIVEIKSNIGVLDFLLIAINKKSVNEGELALCYQEGLEKKLPVLLLMNGKPSKKGQKILEGFKGHLTMRKL